MDQYRSRGYNLTNKDAPSQSQSRHVRNSLVHDRAVSFGRRRAHASADQLPAARTEIRWMRLIERRDQRQNR